MKKIRQKTKKELEQAQQTFLDEQIKKIKKNLIKRSRSQFD